MQEPMCLKTPRMILFDFGQTLLDQSGFHALEGTRAVLARAQRNPRRVTAEEVQRLADHLDQEIRRAGGEAGAPLADTPVLEPSCAAYMKYLYGYFDVEFSIPSWALEEIYWDAACPLRPTEGIGAFLSYLQKRGIRTGVVSNFSFCGETLQRRTGRALPDHSFSWFLVSSDIMFRKPHPLIFQMAVKKADLPPEDIWFCGDQPAEDVDGSARAGMTPVWYTGAPLYPWKREPEAPCVKVSRWDELQVLLDGLPPRSPEGV